MIEIFDCAQNSEEWYLARLGIPTASHFSTVMAKGKDKGVSITRKRYMYKLAGERITGEPEEGYKSADMERGHAMEDEARANYEFDTSQEAKLVGFVRNGGKGASPDSFVGNNGILEIKTNKPSVLVERLLRSDVSPEYKAQIQGLIWVTEREWCDLICYWPKMPICIRREYRDDDYISNLAQEVTKFNDELDILVENLRK